MAARISIWIILAAALSAVAAVGLVVALVLQQPNEHGEAPGEPLPVSPAHSTTPTVAAPTTAAYHHETVLADVLLATVRDLGIEPATRDDAELTRQAAAASIELDGPLLPPGQCDQLRAVPDADRSDVIARAVRVCDTLPEAP